MVEFSGESQLLRSVAELVRPRKGPLDIETDAQSEAWRMPGFSGECKVLTSFGALPISALRRNDPLKTQDGRYMKVTWVDKIMLDHEFLEAHPEAQPVRLAHGAIGRGLPERDMLVSPAQSVQVAAHHGRPTFRTASAAMGAHSITRGTTSSVTYYLFGLQDACAVNVDGIWCQLPKSDGIASIQASR